MTIPEITAYVMALPAEELRRLTATDVMGWSVYEWDINPESLPYIYYGTEDNKRIQEVRYWRPDTDRNQSRQVTNKIKELGLWIDYCRAIVKICHNKELTENLVQIDAIDESRAALIAHMIHAEESRNATDE